MNQLREYTVEIFNLSNKEHQFEFEIDDAFFGLFPNDLVNKGKGLVKVILNKSETMIRAAFNIDVEVELVCDRSLESFAYPIKIAPKMIFKFGEEDQEISDEISMIHWETQRLNFAHLLFEFIGTEIPMKKLHPRFLDEDHDDEDEALVYTSADSDDEKTSEETDPRWSALNKLKE